MTQQVKTICYTINAKGAGNAYRGIGLDGTQAGADSEILGFSQYDYEAGVNIEVNAGPTSIAEAGAEIDGTESKLKMDATGRVIPITAGTDVVVAYVKPGQTTAAAGITLEVIVP